MVQGKGYLVQKVGRSGVLHDIASFDNIPSLHQNLRIEYDSRGSLSKVSAVEVPAKTKSNDLGR